MTAYYAAMIIVATLVPIIVGLGVFALAVLIAYALLVSRHSGKKD